MLRVPFLAAVLLFASCGGDSSTKADAAAVDAAPLDAATAVCCTLELRPATACGCLKIGGPTPPDGICPERCSVSEADFNVMPGDRGCLINVIPQNSVCEPPDAG